MLQKVDITRVRREVEPGVELSVLVAGPADGELVIFLHGFPEAAFAWEPYLEHFAGLGYRVLAPDQRGYNLSDKPAGVNAYRLDRLALDVVALIESEGRKSACIVGHDWGAAVGWWTAIRHPDAVQRLTVLNVPHPLVFRRFILKSPSQLAKSWYMFFFQMPWLPERQFTTNAEVTWDRIAGTGRPDTFSDRDRERLIDAWRQPDAARCMLNWYRAALRQAFAPVPDDVQVKMPTLILWGEQDLALRRELAPASAELCDNVRVEMFSDATHWILHEERPALFGHMQDHFQSRSESGGPA